MWRDRGEMCDIREEGEKEGEQMNNRGRVENVGWREEVKKLEDEAGEWKEGRD